MTSTEKTEAGKIVINDFIYDDAGNTLGKRAEIITNASAGLPATIHVSLYGDEPDEAMTPAFYEYNNKNQMTEAQNGGNIVKTTFSAEGFRAIKTEDGVTTRYFYEYDKVIKAAHDGAESVRVTAGYSGGSDGKGNNVTAPAKKEYTIYRHPFPVDPLL